MQAPYRCFACMQPVEDKHSRCPHCGYENQIRENGPGMLTETTLNQQYLVGRVLGRGGFGITYIGYDYSLDRIVAIKEYFPSHLVSRDGQSQMLSVLQDSVELFRKGRANVLRESRLAAGLGQIRGVVQIYNAISANNTIYIIMEYIEGCTLKSYMEQAQQPVSVKEAIALLEPVAKALQELHSRKVIHRDVKPENIMVRKQDGETVLLDFGSARIQDGSTLSHSAAVVSAGYSPIEQYSSYGLDGRLDQYALCATLHYVLTGDAPKEALMRVAEGEALESMLPHNASVNADVQAVLFKGMAMNARDRYETLQEMWKALISAADARPRMAAWKKAAAIAAAAAAVAGIAAFYAWLGTEDVHHYESEIRRFAESVASGYEGHIEPLQAEIEALLAAAAQPGAAEEQFQLGNLYRDGTGVEQNDRKAADCYRQAAEEGHVQAMVELARCFEEGTGVSPNRKRALEWYEKAAQAGAAEAAEAVERLR